jgi:hypothetical protein
MIAAAMLCALALATLMASATYAADSLLRGRRLQLPWIWATASLAPIIGPLCVVLAPSRLLQVLMEPRTGEPAAYLMVAPHEHEVSGRG